jgi:hypothetical protein
MVSFAVINADGARERCGASTGVRNSPKSAKSPQDAPPDVLTQPFVMIRHRREPLIRASRKPLAARSSALITTSVGLDPSNSIKASGRLPLQPCLDPDGIDGGVTSG